MHIIYLHFVFHYITQYVILYKIYVVNEFLREFDAPIQQVFKKYEAVEGVDKYNKYGITM